jgi:hypothetical protein
MAAQGLKVTPFPLNPNLIPDNFFSFADNSVTPSVETEPQLSTSIPNKFRDPESSASSATYGIYIYIASKHLLEISPVPKIATAFSKSMNRSAISLL